MKQLPNHDLEERTAKFGENVIEFCKRVKLTPINKSIVMQLIRSATSVGGALYGSKWCKL